MALVGLGNGDGALGLGNTTGGGCRRLQASWREPFDTRILYQSAYLCFRLICVNVQPNRYCGGDVGGLPRRTNCRSCLTEAARRIAASCGVRAPVSTRATPSPGPRAKKQEVAVALVGLGNGDGALGLGNTTGVALAGASSYLHLGTWSRKHITNLQ